MKKIGMTLLLLWNGVRGISGQTYDRIATFHYGNGEKLNLIDAQGQKQGLWLYYHMFFNDICSGLSSKRSDTCFRQTSRGRFEKNKKVGVWEYYNDGGCFLGVSKRETFHLDGSVEVQENQIQTHYSPDSSLVVSKVWDGKDSVCIQCEDRKKCTVRYENQLVNTFSYENLGLEQYGFSIGFYRRKLQLIPREHAAH